VLHFWRERAGEAGRHAMRFELADVCSGLSFDHHPFGAVIDKGTIDEILASGEDGTAHAAAALHVLADNLRPGGVLLLLSHAPPEMRLPLLQEVQWCKITVRCLLPPNAEGLAAAEGHLCGATPNGTLAPPNSSALSDVGLQPGLNMNIDIDFDKSMPFGASFTYLCHRPG
jgi:hypothetical protein